MMRKLFPTPLIMFAALYLVSGAQAQTLEQNLEQSVGQSVVVRVNGVPITREQIALVERDYFMEMGHMSAHQRREAAINHLIDRTLAAEQAEKAGLAADPEVVRRLAFLRREVLQDVYVMRLMDERITQAAITDYYHREIAAMPNTEEIHARHILVASRAEAQAIATDLAHGADFATLAKAHSKGPSATAGGDLGYFRKEAMVAPFANAAFALKEGAVSAPVQTQFGWHIIKLEARRMRPAPRLGDVHGQISQVLMGQVREDFYAGLRATAKIEFVPPQ